MKRHEAMAILGAYSRQGFSAEHVAGGFLVESMGFRSMKEARIDTGVDFQRVSRETYRMAINFDLR